MKEYSITQVFKPQDGWKTAFCVQSTVEKVFKTFERLEAVTTDLDNQLFIKICVYLSANCFNMKVHPAVTPSWSHCEDFISQTKQIKCFLETRPGDGALHYYVYHHSICLAVIQAHYTT